MTILILGGTGEAAELAQRLAGSSAPALVSLAGRTSAPKPSALPVRVGGFGGVSGLAAFLRSERIAVVVDATHPFARVMPFNAAEACAVTGTRLLALRRPEWRPEPGDDWRVVESMEAAVEALGKASKRVFLTVGRLELGPFARAPQHRYLVRTIEPIGDALPLPGLTVIADRGPFALAGERALISRERVELLVTKNSGGEATRAKLVAAREGGIPVVVVARPPKPTVPGVETADAAMAWLAAHGLIPADRGV